MIYINLLSLNEAKLYGVGVFLKSLIANSPRDEWIFNKEITFIYHEGLDIASLFDIKCLSMKVHLKPISYINNKICRVLYEQVILPFILNSGDLIYSPNNINPILSPLGTKSIITIHDLLPFRGDNRFGFIHRTYLRLFTFLSAVRSVKIYTVSNHSKKGIVDFLGVDKEKITVIYNFVTPPTLASCANRKREPFFLTIASIHEDKQIDCSIRALKILFDNDVSCSLFIVGRDFGYQSKLEKLVESSGLSDRVFFLGFIDDKKKWELLIEASGLILFGKDEGFGIPVIEAMAVGTPSIVANSGALPEIVGGGGNVVDPHDPLEVASVMRLYLSHPPDRTRIMNELSRFSPKENSFLFWKGLIDLHEG